MSTVMRPVMSIVMSTMRKGRAVLAGSMVAAVMLSGCGVARVTEPQPVAGGAVVGSSPADPGPAPARLEAAKVYFVRKGKLASVFRPLNLRADTTATDVIDLVLRELTKGPTKKERESGYSSSISSIAPAGRRGMVVSIINGGVASIDIGINEFTFPKSNDQPDATATAELQAVAQVLFTVIDARPRTGGITLTFQEAPIRQADGNQVLPPPTPISNVPTEIRGLTPEVIYPEYYPCLGMGVCKPENTSTSSTVPGASTAPTTKPVITIPPTTVAPFLVTTIPLGSAVKGPTLPSTTSSTQSSTSSSTSSPSQTTASDTAPASIAQNPSRIVPTGLRTTGNFFSVAPGSSKGRTSGFGPENGGSNPSPGTLMKRRRT